MRQMLLAGLFALPVALPAAAQEGGARTRVALGPQVVPSFPGSKDHNVRPLVDVARARGSDIFAFEAVDESFDLELIDTGGLSIGPALGFEGSRRRSDMRGAAVEEVGFTVEAGAYAQYWLGEGLRARIELRKGIGGHRGLVGSAGLDVVKRQGDSWLLAIGPRVGFSDSRYQRTWFGVSPAVAAATGLARHDTGSGIHSLGLTAGGVTQLSPRLGLYAYAKYDRLVGNAGDSPLIKTYGSRDQLSSGVALTYTFGRVGRQ